MDRFGFSEKAGEGCFICRIEHRKEHKAFLEMKSQTFLSVIW